MDTLEKLLIITPVKNSIDTALKTIKLVCANKCNAHQYWVYNDYSTQHNRVLLEKNSLLGYSLIHIEDKIKNPSPNYRYTLIDAQKRALTQNAHLLIIESDVFIKKNTIEELTKFAGRNLHAGMIAAITTDDNGRINFPYTHIKPNKTEAFESKHRISFCCTLITNKLLQHLSFENLSEKKHWFDVQISHDSRKLGFKNYILPAVKVQHLAHGSRPWKKLKYSNPIKYYLRKWFMGFDRI